jgi:hypothetical protein
MSGKVWSVILGRCFFLSDSKRIWCFLTFWNCGLHSIANGLDGSLLDPRWPSAVPVISSDRKIFLLCFFVEFAFGFRMRLFELLKCERRAVQTSDPYLVEITECLFEGSDATQLPPNDNQKGGAILIGDPNINTDATDVTENDLRISFCEFVRCKATIGGGAASIAKPYKVEFTTSRGCIATKAGAFCLLRGA